MANLFTNYASTCYTIIQDQDGNCLNINTNLLEAYDAGSPADYKLAFAADNSGPAGRQIATYTVDASQLPAVLTAPLFDNTTDTEVGGFSIALNASGVEVVGGDNSEVLARLTPGVVVFTSPVGPDRNMTIVKADAYATADGRQIAWTLTDYSGPAVGGVTSVAMNLLRSSEYSKGAGAIADASFAGSIATVGADAVITVQLTSADTDALGYASYTYTLTGLAAGARPVEFLRGRFSVLQNIPLV
jgi:hypothetical protein